MGDGTLVDRKTPVRVKNLTNVYAVASGSYYHSLALKKDGTVWAWGSNDCGQLGDGTLKDSKIPVKVKGIDNVTQIANGTNSSYAVKKDGTLWAWGWNGAGQLGDGTTTDKKSPVKIKSLKNIVSVSAGFRFAAAVLNDGTLWTWGDIFIDLIDYNQDKTQPQKVRSMADIKAVSAGDYHFGALKNDGSLWISGELDSSYSKMKIIKTDNPSYGENVSELETGGYRRLWNNIIV